MLTLVADAGLTHEIASVAKPARQRHLIGLAPATPLSADEDLKLLDPASYQNLWFLMREPWWPMLASRRSISGAWPRPGFWSPSACSGVELARKHRLGPDFVFTMQRKE